MNNLKINDVKNYVNENIGIFHQKRINRIMSLKLNAILKKKNPYLFKAKNILTSEKLILAISDAYLSSQEETIFGDWLEGLAIFISGKVYGGRKSSTPGIDLEFDVDKTRFIVNIKSGPNWGNSSQVAKMRFDFSKAMKTIRTSNSKLSMVAVNGCCYGIDNNPDKGDYFKYCGQAFWEFISGLPNLYIDIIEPLGYKAKEKNDAFYFEYAKMINKFTLEFSSNFCNYNGEINWNKLVEFNSGK